MTAKKIASVKHLAEHLFTEIQTIRQHLHQYPELSYQEFQTSAFIQSVLKKWNIDFVAPVAGTGIVVTLKGKKTSTRCIALRADIDALPIQEENDVPYASKNKNVMHACGHDAHTSCLLGAIKILDTLKEEWGGTIKCLFQPGEEKNPGGASLMIQEGVLKNPDVQSILALHVHTTLDVGKFSFRGGKCMASADEIYITIKSKGGHAAAPHLTTDTILVASHLVVALQQVVSRNNDPFNPSVLTISSIQGGNTTNVIPSEVKLMGTFRAMDETWRKIGHEKITQIVTHTAKSMNAEIDLWIDVGYPMVYNNEELTKEARHLAENFIGAEHCSETELRMGAEDFGYYSQLVKACFFRLGVRPTNAKNISPVHTPTFNIDEHALQHGMAMMAWLGMNVE